MLSTKNAQLSAAGADLGLGDQLKQQVEDELLQRKKKKNMVNPMQQMQGVMSPAVNSLFPQGGVNG